MRHAMLAISATLLLSGAAALAADEAATSGETWEVTSQMTMEGAPSGFAMPAHTQRICADRSWKKPPVAADEKQNCEMLDWKTTGSTSTWKMRCAGPPAMNGNGEITRTSPDAYKGVMNMSTEQGAMKINLSGRKVGDCDAQAAKADRDAQMARIEAQVAAGQKMAADARQQMCMTPVESMNLAYLNQLASTCEGPSYKAAFCEKLNTRAGWEMTCVREKKDPANALSAVAAFCGADAAAITKPYCDELAKTEANIDLIGQCCPVVAKAIAQRECGGLKYTSQMAQWGSFCATYAKDAVAADSAEPSPSPESSSQKAKKKLKSLFGK